MGTKWTNVKLPNEQVEAVRVIIEGRPELGYTSPGDFYRAAARDKLDAYQNLPTDNY